MRSLLQKKMGLVVALLFCFCCQAVTFAAAEDGDKIYAEARTLIQQQKFAAALPLLEKAVKAQPDNAMAHYFLGFSLLVTAEDIPDETRRKSQRVRARNAWIRSKQLGVEQPNVDALIAQIPPDGSPLEEPPLSQNKQANTLMIEAEELYTGGKLDEALAKYQQALKLDPKIYEAALFSGDVYMHRKDYGNAETWYQKAIAIDPNRETGYRYSATPLMHQGKTDEARDRYIEAYITEPYNRFTVGGLQQWAKATGSTLHDLDITIPATVTYDNAGNPTINLDPKAIAGGKSDGSFAWSAYGLVRSTWHSQKFAKAFPGEKPYRHSLPEEAEALRAVIKLAEGEKTGKELNPNLAKLKTLDSEGLLEAFILLNLANEGIAEDHPQYLQQHRDLLRKFMKKYVIDGE